MERCSWPSRFIAQSQERARVSAKDESFLSFNSATGTLFVDGTPVAEESPDRQGARHRGASDGARARRRGDRVKRRKFITLFAGAAAWPLAVRAQQGANLRRIDFLANDPVDRHQLVGLAEVGNDAQLSEIKLVAFGELALI